MLSYWVKCAIDYTNEDHNHRLKNSEKTCVGIDGIFLNT